MTPPLRSITLVLLALAAAATLAAQFPVPGDARVLYLGNSLFGSKDGGVPGYTNAALRQMGHPGVRWGAVLNWGESLAWGLSHPSKHNSILPSGQFSSLVAAIRGGLDGNPATTHDHWQYVVLQGYGDDDDTTNRILQPADKTEAGVTGSFFVSVTTLQREADAIGAETILYMRWPNNPVVTSRSWYDSQLRNLDANYRTIAAHLGIETVVPVATITNELTYVNPPDTSGLGADNRVDFLYVGKGDNIHQGKYGKGMFSYALAAYFLRQSPVGRRFQFADYTGIDPAIDDAIQSAVWSVVSRLEPWARGVEVATSSLEPAYRGVPYLQTLVAAGGTPPRMWSLAEGGLPAGLALDPSTGAISGTPTTVQTAAFTVRVTDASSPVPFAASRALTIEVLPVPALEITTPSLPGGLVGTAYAQTLAARFGTPPYRWSLATGTLPAGLTLDAASGALRGTPTAAGSSTFTVQVEDASAHAPATAQKVLSLRVDGSAPALGFLAVTSLSVPVTVDFDTRLEGVCQPATGTGGAAVLLESGHGDRGGTRPNSASGFHPESIAVAHKQRNYSGRGNGLPSLFGGDFNLNGATNDAFSLSSNDVGILTGANTVHGGNAVRLSKDDDYAWSTLYVRIRNATGAAAEQWSFAFDILAAEDDANLSQLQFSHAVGDAADPGTLVFTPFGTPPALAATGGALVHVGRVFETISVSVPDGGHLVLAIADVADGARSSLVLIDNLTITVTPIGGDAGGYAGWADGRTWGGADRDPEADPDGDGLANFLEYALGGDPLARDGASAFEAFTGDSGPGLRFLRANAGVTYIVETSTDLASWRPVAVNPGDVGEVVAVEVPVSDRAFLRLLARE